MTKNFKRAARTGKTEAPKISAAQATERLLFHINQIKIRGGRLSGYQNFFGEQRGSEMYREDIKEYVRLSKLVATFGKAG